jgi:hypothetical protein
MAKVKGRSVAASMVLNRVIDCDDILPSSLCDALDIERGSTYAEAAKALLREGH